MNAIAAPLIAELWSTGRRAELQRLATFAARCVFAATALLVLLLAALGRPTLALFGDGFPAGYGPLLVLAAGQATSALVGSVGLLLSMTGHQKEAARIMLAAALANVVLNALLIPRFGLLGAAVATAATTAAWNLAMLVRVVRTLGIDPTVLRIRTRRDPSAGDPHP
jgi:O-antigen/teichoic acid export membrane protein